METTPTIAETLQFEAYRPEELAELLSIDIEVIRHAVYTHALPARMVGRDIVSIQRSDVLDWLATRG